MKRRQILQGAAAAVSVLAPGGGVWRAIDRGVFAAGEGTADEPWHNLAADSRGPAFAAVRAAILAANPHNTQPWLFRVSDARIDVFADRRRNIGVIDPYLREMYAGVGCALENLMLGAAASGLDAEIVLMPTPGDPGHAARIIWLDSATARPSALYSAIPRRHTNRGAYRTDLPVKDATRTALSALNDDAAVRVFWLASDEQRARARELIVAATEAIVGDAAQSRDSAKWFRLQWAETQSHRDGITIDAMGAAPLVRAAAKWLPPLSTATNDRYWLQTTREVHVATAAAFGILAVRDLDDLAQRLRAGRTWQRMQLWATLHGLALQPLNQLPERAAREQVMKLQPRFGDALRELQGDASWQALMVFRAGYPRSPALASPRRDMGSVLL